MNARTRHGPAAVQRTKRHRHEAARGRKDDGCIEPVWRLITGIARPLRPQFQCQPPVPLRPREGGHLAAPMPRDLDRDVRRGSEAVQAQPLGALRPGDPQRPQADDPGAQQRRGLERVHIGPDMVGKVRLRDHRGCEAAIHIPASEACAFAQVLLPASAEAALPAGRVQPRHADRIPNREPLDALAEPLDRADDLVAGDDRQLVRGKIAFDDMQVRVADRARANPDEQLARPRLRVRQVTQAQRRLLDGGLLFDDHRSHGGSPSLPPSVPETAVSLSPPGTGGVAPWYPPQADTTGTG